MLEKKKISPQQGEQKFVFLHHMRTDRRKSSKPGNIDGFRKKEVSYNVGYYNSYQV